MTSVNFEDLFQQAESLNTGLDNNGELPRVQRNIQQLLNAGDQLCAKVASQDNAKVKASLLLCSKGQEAPEISDRLKSLTSAPEVIANVLATTCDTDIKGYLQNERQAIILSLLEEQKQKTFKIAEERHAKMRLREFEQDRQQIMTQLLGSGDRSQHNLNFTSNVVDAVNNVTVTSDYESSTVKSSMTQVELLYANQLNKYNDQVISGNVSSTHIVDLFLEVAEKANLTNIATVWKMIGCMVKSTDKMSSVTKMRNSPSTMLSLINSARRHLEESFLEYMRKCVFEQAQFSQPGGHLGCLNLVKSFLKLTQHQNEQYDDSDKIDELSLWKVVFYCLRCGDVSAACESMIGYQHVMPNIYAWLVEYKENGKLSPSSESNLRVAYRKQFSSTHNPYKLAVYSIIGKCDISDVHGEVAKATEDYMWIKLCQVVIEDSSHYDSLSLIKLQKILSEEYGENHFKSDPLLYFKVLFLTCQFESAIEYLYRHDSFKVHAVHIGIALYSCGLLLTPANIHYKLLTKSQDALAITKTDELNIARLLMLYTVNFKSTDCRQALNYFYLLRDITTTTDNNTTQSLFYKCVTKLISDTNEYEMILGKLNADGSRQLGLIDKYCGNDSGGASKIISNIAKESESKGCYEDAVLLFDLCGDHNRAIQLLNKILSPVIKYSDAKNTDRKRIKKLSISIAKRYSEQAIKTNKSATRTLYLLLDLCSFFDCFHNDQVKQALDVINELDLLPIYSQQVDGKVEEFKLQCEEVRANIGDILITTMILINKQYSSSNKSNQHGMMASLRERSKNLLTFAGMLPYLLPQITMNKLVQLSVLMS